VLGASLIFYFIFEAMVETRVVRAKKKETGLINSTRLAFGDK
jgi:hypothetical protein